MIFKLVLLIILILINGIFSATEIAFLSLSKYDLHKELKKGNKKASKILELINDSSTFLSAIQIAITLSGFLASAFAAENFASEIASIINIQALPKETLTGILIILITIILSYFTLVFGELIPKKIGMSYSKEISFMMVNIISLVILFFKPFIIILKSSVDFFSKLIGIKDKEKVNEDELKNTIGEAALEEFERSLLFNVIEFNDTTVKEAMTPKEDVVFINKETTPDDLMKKLRKYKFTRFPIENDGKVVGFLNVKDIIIKNKKDFKLENYIRRLPKINSDMYIDDAFLYLRSKQEVIAQVIDDKEVIGIVTIEDIVEELVGSIVDEYN